MGGSPDTSSPPIITQPFQVGGRVTSHEHCCCSDLDSCVTHRLGSRKRTLGDIYRHT